MPMEYGDNATARPYDELMNFRFNVEVEGMGSIKFEKVDGLEIAIEILERRSGNDPDHTRKIPGKVSFGDITMTKGQTKDNTLYTQWVKPIAGLGMRRDCSALIRKTLHIEELTCDRSVAKAWVAEGCIVKNYKPGDFDANGNDILLESLVVAVENLYLDESMGATASGGATSLNLPTDVSYSGMGA